MLIGATKYRVVENLIDGQTVEPWKIARLDATVSDMAPDGAVAAVVNAKKITPADAEWYLVPPSGSRVTFAVTEAKPEYLIPVYGAYLWWKDIFTGEMFRNIFDMFSPDIPKPPGPGDSTYGFGDIQPTGANGAAIPVAYGFHPNSGLIAQHLTTEGEENNQRYEGLFILSHGPIEAIGDAASGTENSYTSDQTDLSADNIPGGTWINGTISDENFYKNLSVSLRLGATTQTPMVRTIVRQFPMDFVLKYGADSFRYQTRGICDAVEVDLHFPRGLFKTKSSGKLKSEDCTVRLQVFDDEDPGNSEYNVAHNIRKKLQRPIHVTKGAYEYDGLSGANASRKTVIVSKESSDRPTEKKPTSVNEVHVVAVKEIQNVPIAYNGLAATYAKVQASEQLSGGIPSFVWMGKWRKVQTSNGTVWSGTETWSSNPAYVCADILTSKRYGLGSWHSHDDLDPAEWKAWADFCDEQVDLYTGAATTEKRAEFHGVFMESGRAFDMAASVARVGLAALVRSGRKVSPILGEDRAYSAVVNSASVSDPVMSYAGERGRSNVVEVRFRNRERPNYEMDVATARVAGLDENDDAIRKLTVDHIGCTSPWQAYRFAHRLLRAETMTRRALSFEASKETLQFAIGDVFLYVDDELRFGVAGSKLAGGVDSPAETYLERDVTFEADVIYTYAEQSLTDDTVLSRDFSFATTQTVSTLPFEPLHGGGVGDPTPIGRPYTITKKGTERLFRVVALGSPNDGMRKVEAVEHVASVFSDEAPELDEGVETPTFSTVNSASAVVITETSTRDGISTLSVAFTAGAGSNKRHKVFYHVGALADSGMSAGPEKAASPIAFDLEVEMGAPVTCYIQTINEDGASDISSSWPSATHVIEREDDGQAIVNIPDAITAASFAVALGNATTLSWTPGADYDALNDTFEVRFGTWNDGHVVYEGSTDSFSVVRPVHGTRYEIRTKRDGYYSPSGYVDSAAVAHVTYAVATLSEDIDLQTDGTASNMIPVPDWHQFNGPLLQAVPEAPCSYLSETYDLGNPAAATLVSLDPRVQVFFTPQTDDDYWMSQQHVGANGELNKTYLDWTLTVEHSTDGSTWTNVDWTTYANADLVVTARYFRFRFTASALATEDDTTLRYGLAMLERLNVALRRA